MTITEQYRAARSTNPGKLVIVKCGDFYELFEDQAELVAKEIGLVLTRRGTMPMCGFPIFRADEYLHLLISAGHQVHVVN